MVVQPPGSRPGSTSNDAKPYPWPESRAWDWVGSALKMVGDQVAISRGLGVIRGMGTPGGVRAPGSTGARISASNAPPLIEYLLNEELLCPPPPRIMCTVPCLVSIWSVSCEAATGLRYWPS